MRTGLLVIFIVLGGCSSGSPPAEAGARTDTFGEHADEQWYFWTDDDVRHFAFETGRANGPGDTIIVLHGGWGAEHSYLVEPLSRVGDRYRLVFYDQRGSLRSPAPDSTIRLSRFVDDLDHLRESLGLERVTLLAHSMGGALAYAYLARHPQRVRGLVLVGAVHPAAYSDGPNEEFLAQVWPEADAAALAERRDNFFREFGERALAVVDAEGLLPDSLRGVPWDSLNLWPIQRDRERTRTWRITFTAVNTCNPSGWRDMKGGMAYYSQNVANHLMGDPAYREMSAGFWPALEAFPGPVRVLHGTCDYVDLGPEIWPRVVEGLPDGSLDVIQDTGHSIWMDRPDAFEMAVRRALSDAAGS